METMYRKTVTAGNVYTETTADYILPDYQGDIKKVLSSEARILPTGKFMSGSEAQFAGSVAYEVLYVDSEGKVTSAAFSSDYEYAVPTDAGALDAAADMRVSGLNVRLSGPRRISAKCNLSARVYTTTEDSLETSGTALEADMHPELCEKTLSVRHTVLGESGEREYTEAVTSPCTSAESLEILSRGGNAVIKDIRAGEGSVVLTAEMSAYVWVSCDGGVPTEVTHTWQAEETFDVPDMKEGMAVLGRATVKDVRATVGADADGGCALLLGTTVTYSVRGEENLPLDIVTDGYLCEYACDTKYEDFTYEEFFSCDAGTFSAEGDFPLSEEDRDLAEILYTKAQIKSLRTLTDEEGVDTVEADVLVTTVGRSGDGEGTPRFITVKNTVSVSEALPPVNGRPEGAKADVDVCLLSAVGTPDGENLHIDLTFSYGRTLTVCRTVRRLSCAEALTDRPTASRRGRVTVYYPSAGDTLFDIARHYLTTSAALARDNRLAAEAVATRETPASLSGVEKLLILPE